MVLSIIHGKMMLLSQIFNFLNIEPMQERNDHKFFKNSWKTLLVDKQIHHNRRSQNHSKDINPFQPSFVLHIEISISFAEQ